MMGIAQLNPRRLLRYSLAIVPRSEMLHFHGHAWSYGLRSPTGPHAVAKAAGTQPSPRFPAGRGHRTQIGATWEDRMAARRRMNENPLITFLLSPNCTPAAAGGAPALLPFRPFLLLPDISLLPPSIPECVQGNEGATVHLEEGRAGREEGRGALQRRRQGQGARWAQV